jgi:hypothetical protein
MRDYLDLGGLRKHIERRHRLDFELIAEFDQVASERRRIARNIDKIVRREIDNPFANRPG